MDHTYCILHQLSFDINFYETNLGNVIKLAGLIVSGTSFIKVYAWHGLGYIRLL